ncbi:hypothetical protein C8R44DRAFT_751030 [Mycena epipterygia]|nr:hypothetical protein C8R44DRAFT_751030 [Mycena epipterygia]
MQWSADGQQYRRIIQDDREQAQIQKEIRRSEVDEKEEMHIHTRKACWQKKTFAHFWEIPDGKYQGGLIPESSIIWTNSEINGRELLSRQKETCTPTPQLIEIYLTRLSDPVSNKSQSRSNAPQGFSHCDGIPDDVNELRDGFGRGSAKLGPMQHATGPMHD